MAPQRAASSSPFRASWDCRFASSAQANRLTTWFLSMPKLMSIPFSTDTVNEHDIRFLQHALALARKGVGLASPNPMVGCVVVRNGEIVGEGFHQYEWRDHAEIVAMKSAGEKTHGATLYVSLEPCNHAGRTGPCTEAIIKAGVTRVVMATRDKNPKV